MNYIFEPRTVDQEGVENCGYIWRESPRQWICTCHETDAERIIVALTKYEGERNEQ